MSNNEVRRKTTIKTFSEPTRTSEAMTQARRSSIIVESSYPNDAFFDELDSEWRDSCDAPIGSEVTENVITTSFPCEEGDIGEKPTTASRENSSHSSQEDELTELTSQQNDISQPRNKWENTLLYRRDKLAHVAREPLQ